MLGTLLQRRSKRTALLKKNLDYLLWRYVQNGGRAWRARATDLRYPEINDLARELDASGIISGSNTAYLSEDGQAALAEASSLILGMAKDAMADSNGPQVSSSKNYLVELVRGASVHEPESPLLKVALDTKLLEIVAAYLGLWPSLYSVGAWLNFPTENEPEASQLWHRDPEDLKIVKVFIYLVDVDEQRGPFCYIPETQSFGRHAGRIPSNNNTYRVSDEDMAAVIDPEYWMACTGPAGTMILADTVGFHRGGNAIDGNRILVTFTYTSGIPLKPSKARVRKTPDWIKDQIQRAASPAVELS